jgi:hypothetical protein
MTKYAGVLALGRDLLPDRAMPITRQFRHGPFQWTCPAGGSGMDQESPNKE